ncbi:hypothetical protein GQ457_11G005090 [Hibiscus cannabinus]
MEENLKLHENETFLSSLRDLQPELCITAAYGNILPTKFLNIPPLGTVNIHPSLLPLYCGAAPVQRTLELAFTERALDAGPVIAREKVKVDDQIKTVIRCAVTFLYLITFLLGRILSSLSYAGSKLLVCKLPSIFDGSAKVNAEPQDDSKVTLAPKARVPSSLISVSVL